MGDGSTNSLTAAETAAGWRLLFDGTTLDGWRGFTTAEPPPSWKPVDGTLLRVADGGDLMTVDQYGDFELAARVEGRHRPATAASCSASPARAPAPTKPGPRCRCSTTPAIPTARIRGPRPGPTMPCTRRSATSPGRPASGTPCAWWSEGAHVEHWMNGEKLLEYELWSADWEARVKASKFAAWPAYGRARRGHIVLQDHGDAVAFRNIRIRTAA